MFIHFIVAIFLVKKIAFYKLYKLYQSFYWNRGEKMKTEFPFIIKVINIIQRNYWTCGVFLQYFTAEHHR